VVHEEVLAFLAKPLDRDLSSLGDHLTEKEVHEAIKALPSDKAPGRTVSRGYSSKLVGIPSRKIL
jgi:hypothetical protein